MEDKIKGYAIFFIVFLAFYLFYLMIKSFFASIFFAILFSYIFFPLNKFFSNIFFKFNRNIAPFIVMILVILIVFIPFSYLVFLVINEIPKTYNFLLSILQSNLFNDISRFFLETFNFDLKQVVFNSFNSLFSYLKEFLFSLPNKFMNIFLTFFLLFFFLRDGEFFITKAREFSPFSEKETLILFREVKNITDAIIYGQVLTAFLQAVVAFLGFYFLGFGSSLLLAFLTFFVSIIPMIGPSFVYLPVGIFSILLGLSNQNPNEINKGLFLIIYGFLIISSVDNVIKPLVISDKTTSHPVLVMLGIIGGLYAFGFIGVFIGPIIMVVVETLFKIYRLRNELNDKLKPNKKRIGVDV
ncbi:MAG: AI-2E family transporter [Candidatus Woesearchaeota archaeon]